MASEPMPSTRCVDIMRCILNSHIRTKYQHDFHAILPPSQIVYISQGQQSDPAPPEVTDIYVRVNLEHQNKVQKERHACTTGWVDRCTPCNIEYHARSENRIERTKKKAKIKTRYTNSSRRFPCIQRWLGTTQCKS